uniref:Uncharacterized protein n=1 Tax=Corethron hystrix TaxID=216773 RepID=A0A7S1BD11_9STRA
MFNTRFQQLILLKYLQCNYVFGLFFSRQIYCTKFSSPQRFADLKILKRVLLSFLRSLDDMCIVFLMDVALIRQRHTLRSGFQEGLDLVVNTIRTDVGSIFWRRVTS